MVGILGPNATGKSTFVKMLAGEIAPDNTEFKTDLKISYKPQYLKSDFDGTVRDFIACQEDFEKDVFESEIKNQMNLDVLMGVKMNDLSGGQHQRVAVSVAMAKKADLYLLDEPSAFFDIDQRLEVAGVIRRVTEKRGSTTLVVDHDILVIDFISDRLLNFSGESSKQGFASKITDMRTGMNSFLKEMAVTFRRDQQTGRPRANKPGSQLDSGQKSSGEYYYK